MSKVLVPLKSVCRECGWCQALALQNSVQSGRACELCHGRAFITSKCQDGAIRLVSKVLGHRDVGEALTCPPVSGLPSTLACPKKPCGDRMTTLKPMGSLPRKFCSTDLSSRYLECEKVHAAPLVSRTEHLHHACTRCHRQPKWKGFSSMLAYHCQCQLRSYSGTNCQAFKPIPNAHTGDSQQ